MKRCKKMITSILTAALLLGLMSMNVFAAEEYTYTVTFKDWNGNVLDTQTVNYNGNAIYGGTTPSRTADNTYTYTFDGWDQALTNIKSDITVNAKYISTYIDYTVKFVDYDDKELSAGVYHFDDTIVVPANPTKAADKTYTYTFTGWSTTDGGAVAYDAASIMDAPDGTTLYAVWQSE